MNIFIPIYQIIKLYAINLVLYIKAMLDKEWRDFKI